MKMKTRKRMAMTMTMKRATMMLVKMTVKSMKTKPREELSPKGALVKLTKGRPATRRYSIPVQAVGPTPSRDQTALVYPRDAKPGTRQPYTVLPKPTRPAAHTGYRVAQGPHNGSPPVARRPPTRPDFTHPHYPLAPKSFSTQPAPFATSHPRPRRALEGPHRATWPSDVAHPPLFGPSSRSATYRTSGFSSFGGDAAGAPSEWGEGSEAGGSEQRSMYSLQSNMSIARSIYMEQQVARREEEAARREEEARRKEEDARTLEMAARRAFEWVQGLEARAGRIHDAAMEAEAQAKRRDAEIWEREAEVLRKQAETAKREVETVGGSWGDLWVIRTI
ncbi:hypothetical protein BJV74DRAFT_128628 [Russula compacta]|nr:hypothetical protein BJV74DRAFT_128628 [Russula compacta]